tara:strand:- start:178 stop:576 length:399 start_codon:yes stop_codon:yes gene_type:complete
MINNSENNIFIDNITEDNEKRIEELTEIINYQFGILVFILNYVIICKIVPEFTSYLVYLIKQCCMFSLYLVNYQELVHIEEHDRFHSLEQILYDNGDEIKELIKDVDYKLEELEKSIIKNSIENSMTIHEID